MATITDKKAITATLTSTTADRAQLLQFWDWVEVVNHDTSTTLYTTDDGVTAPTAGAEGTVPVLPGERIVLPARPLTTSIPDGSAVICHEIRVVGNGGTYSVVGLPHALNA